jgi:hypothetical protein
VRPAGTSGEPRVRYCPPAGSLGPPGPTLVPIWFPHWPAWMCTISLMARASALGCCLSRRPRRLPPAGRSRRPDLRPPRPRRPSQSPPAPPRDQEGEGTRQLRDPGPGASLKHPAGWVRSRRPLAAVGASWRLEPRTGDGGCGAGPRRHLQISGWMRFGTLPEGNQGVPVPAFLGCSLCLPVGDPGIGYHANRWSLKTLHRCMHPRLRGLPREPI